MIKKLNSILVVAIALSGIPAVAEEAPSTNTLWSNKTYITASVAGILAIVGGLVFYAKKSRGNKLGNAAVPVCDELGQGAVEKAVVDARITLEDCVGRMEKDFKSQVEQLLQKLGERALKTTVERQQQNLDGMVSAVDQLTQLLTGLDNKIDAIRTALIANFDEELSKVRVDLDARVTAVEVNQNVGTKALKELAALRIEVKKAERDILNLGERLADESAARAKLSLKFTKEMEEQIRKAHADIQEFQPVDKRRVRFTLPSIAEGREGRGAGAATENT